MPAGGWSSLVPGSTTRTASASPWPRAPRCTCRTVRWLSASSSSAPRRTTRTRPGRGLRPARSHGRRGRRFDPTPDAGPAALEASLLVPSDIALRMESGSPPRDTAWEMSQENVELIRRYYRAWNGGGLDAVRAFWSDDFQWHDAPGMPDGGVYRGSDAVAAALPRSRGDSRGHGGSHRRNRARWRRGLRSAPCAPRYATGWASSRRADIRDGEHQARQALLHSPIPGGAGGPRSRRAAGVATGTA